MQRSIARLMWLALNPERPLTQLPPGWMPGDYMATVLLNACGKVAEAVSEMENFFWKEGEGFISWLGDRFSQRINLFERVMIKSELKLLSEFAAKRPRTPQLALI